jgi:hypothetical protein
MNRPYIGHFDFLSLGALCTTIAQNLKILLRKKTMSLTELTGNAEKALRNIFENI